jgi:hypothetical protein
VCAARCFPDLPGFCDDATTCAPASDGMHACFPAPTTGGCHAGFDPGVGALVLIAWLARRAYGPQLTCTEKLAASPR